MNEVWVLGSTGMLGTAVIRELEASNLLHLKIDRDFAKSLNLEFEEKNWVC